MSDNSSQQGQSAGNARAASGVTIPPAVQEAHGALIDLILRSESMNDEERQYWIDILPVMTSDQVEQLRTILVNERDQLAAIDAKYAEGVSQESKAQRPLEQIGSERKAKASKRTEDEIQAEKAEAEAEADILKQVQNL